MNKTLVIMCGLPGSGKSTWAKQKAEYEDALYVSKDDIRIPKLDFEKYKNAKTPELRQKYYYHKEDEVRQEFYEKILNGYDTHDVVIADGTNLSADYRTNFIRILCEYGFFDNEDIDLHIVQMRTPVQLCKQRNAGRTGFSRVPDDVIDYYNNFYEFTLEPELAQYVDNLDCSVMVTNVYPDAEYTYFRSRADYDWDDE